jgi:nucleoside-diphosphate-sugar epimerase
MNGRIIVLGADGFIGRRVVSALAESGWATAIAASRRPILTSGSGHPRIERLQLDATDADALKTALAGAQGVINCVAGNADTIVATTRALIDAARISQATVVDFSSMAVYGSATGTINEDTPLLGDTGPYGVAKIEAESIARTYARAVRLRPGIVYGPGSTQWSERIASWLLARRVGDLGAAGDGYCNLVHVDDVATAAVRALRTPAALGQAFNLSLANPPTWNEYFWLYAKALDAVPLRRITARRMKLEKIAAIPLKIAEIVAKKAKLKLALPPPIPPSLPPLWRQELRLDVHRAETLLDMQWRPLEAALKQTAEAYLAR